MNTPWKNLAILTAGILFATCSGTKTAATRRAGPPNIVFILADDLGYGELGCYGQVKIRTPHLDQLAADGMRFTQFYANTLCAPTRCALLTGLHSGEAQVRDNYELGGFRDDEEFGQMPLAPNTFTLGDLLRQAGYTTACIGKWGLGGPASTGEPRRQGFDFFYGYLDQKQAHNYYPTHLWRNETAEPLPNPYFSPHQRATAEQAGVPGYFDQFSSVVYAPDTLTSEAIKFIRQPKDRPFFLYLAYTLPHLSLQAPLRAVSPYAGQFGAELPYLGQRGYLPNAMPRATYAGMITLLDAYVGAIREALRSAGLERNTIVMFASDNGATVPGTGGADTEFFRSNGALRGFKGVLYEGGIRVPLLISWPGIVARGSASAQPCAMWDILPTLGEIAGVPMQYTINGISLLPLLKGKASPLHDYLYWEVHGYEKGIQAVRLGRWKAVRKGMQLSLDPPLELYDLDADPGETTDVAGKYPDVVQQLKALLTKRKRAAIKEWNWASGD